MVIGIFSKNFRVLDVIFTILHKRKNCSKELFEALIPYLKDNKINASKIYSLIRFGLKRQKELEKKYNYQIEIE